MFRSSAHYKLFLTSSVDIIASLKSYVIKTCFENVAKTTVSISGLNPPAIEDPLY